ncbi:MAG: hypothetical protein KDM63_20725, partial [Verrucomicrobiae bacterium]|nr:hypothetical protein [Verrucomicrobiae bacterium]
VIGGIAFLSSLAGAAWLGVESALRSLPESAAGGHPHVAIGISVTIDGNGEPIHLAPDVQSLRDYYFAYQKPDARREGDAEARGLRRIFEPIEVKTLARDADAIQIEVISGPLSGVKAWVHSSQFPPVPPENGVPSKGKSK